MQFAQICDSVETDVAMDGGIDFSALHGTWINSNPDTNGIARIVMSESAGNLSVRIFAIGSDGFIDWGTMDATVFAAAPSQQTCSGFTCLYEFGFAESRLQGMIMKGLLVLAQFHSFKDDSNRADYFVREYFALAHGQH